MEYVTYILIITGIMALCFVLWPEQAREYTLKKSTHKIGTPAEIPRADTALNMETLNVPIPWGWPGHEEHATDNSHVTFAAQEVHGVSESLHRFADRLLSEKQTKESREYQLKKEDSLRALLEDRYGRAYKTPQSNKQNTQSPNVRNPGTPLVKESLHEIKTPWGW